MGFWGTVLSGLSTVGGAALMAVPGMQGVGAAALGAGLGGIKNAAIDAPARQRQAQLAAATARYSPWTGLSAQNVNVPEANQFGSMMQGGVTGYTMAANSKPAGATGSVAGANVPPIQAGMAPNSLQIPISSNTAGGIDYMNLNPASMGTTMTNSAPDWMQLLNRYNRVGGR